MLLRSGDRHSIKPIHARRHTAYLEHPAYSITSFLNMNLPYSLPSGKLTKGATRIARPPQRSNRDAKQEPAQTSWP